jgi:hypothetical protein
LSKTQLFIHKDVGNKLEIVTDLVDFYFTKQKLKITVLLELKEVYHLIELLLNKNYSEIKKY